MRNNASQSLALERIEDMLGSGFPDVMVKGEFLVPVELKAVIGYPARATTRVFGDDGLNQAQKNWWLDYSQRSGRGLIVCSVGGGNSAHHYAIEGRHAQEFNNMNRHDLRNYAGVTCAGSAFWPLLWKYIRGMQS